MCLGGGGSQKVVEVYSDGVVAVENFSGKRHTASTGIVAARDVEIGDYVRVVQGYVTEKVDPVLAKQAWQLMSAAGSDGQFVLESALGDDAYQPEVAANDVAAVFPGQAVLAFG